MDHVISDWQRSDDQTLGTYKNVMRMFLVGTIALVILLALMAFFLV